MTRNYNSFDNERINYIDIDKHNCEIKNEKSEEIK